MKIRFLLLFASLVLASSLSAQILRVQTVVSRVIAEDPTSSRRRPRRWPPPPSRPTKSSPTLICSCSSKTARCSWCKTKTASARSSPSSSDDHLKTLCGGPHAPKRDRPGAGIVSRTESNQLVEPDSALSSEIFKRPCGAPRRRKNGGRFWIRTREGVSQEIYSLPSLAT
jgi:hypothetical protein